MSAIELAMSEGFALTENETEEWRGVEGYSNYEVSSHGRVRVIPKPIASAKYRRRIGRDHTLPIVRKTQPDKDGYEIVTLSKEARKIDRKVHRLVAEAFLDNAAGLPEVNHVDGVKSHNEKSNLEWTTRRDNQKHSFATGLHSGMGETHVHNVLSREQVLEIRRQWSNRDVIPISRSELAKDYLVSEGCISNIVYEKTWKHLIGVEIDDET